jgi:hypothetical protein
MLWNAEPWRILWSKLCPNRGRKGSGAKLPQVDIEIAQEWQQRYGPDAGGPRSRSQNRVRAPPGRIVVT